MIKDKTKNEMKEVGLYTFYLPKCHNAPQKNVKVHIGDKKIDEKWKIPSNKRKNGKEENLKGNIREQQIMKTFSIHLKCLELGEFGKS
jgi:hypothetical protein